MRGPYLKGYAEMAFDTVEVHEEEKKKRERLEVDKHDLPPGFKSTWLKFPLSQEGGGGSDTGLVLPSPSTASSTSSHNGHAVTTAETGLSAASVISSDDITASHSQREPSREPSRETSFDSEPPQSANLIPSCYKVEKSALLLRLQAIQKRGATVMANAESTVCHHEEPASDDITASCSQREPSREPSREQSFDSEPSQSANLIPSCYKVEKSALLLRLQTTQKRGATVMTNAESTVCHHEEPTHTDQVVRNEPASDKRKRSGSEGSGWNGSHHDVLNGAQEMKRRSMFL